MDIIEDQVPDSPLGKHNLQDSFIKHSMASKNSEKSGLNSKSKWRKTCFQLKRDMIFDKKYDFFITFCVGFLFIIPWLISLVIIYNRFDQPFMLKKHYSDALTPLIIELGLIALLISINIFHLSRELFQKGPMVWYRDSLGLLIQQLIVTLSVFATFLKIQEYICIKERRKW